MLLDCKTFDQPRQGLHHAFFGVHSPKCIWPCFEHGQIDYYILSQNYWIELAAAINSAIMIWRDYFGFGEVGQFASRVIEKDIPSSDRG